MWLWGFSTILNEIFNINLGKYYTLYYTFGDIMTTAFLVKAKDKKDEKKEFKYLYESLRSAIEFQTGMAKRGFKTTLERIEI